MLNIKEIKKALKADPKLLDRIPKLREFVNEHRDQFKFLFESENNDNRYEHSTPGQNQKPKKWNPEITPI